MQELSEYIYGKDLISFICTWEGIKPATRLSLNMDKIEQFADICHKFNLNYEESDFNVIPSNDKNIFSNIAERVNDDPKNKLSNKLQKYIYVSKIKKLCQEAKEYDKVNDNLKLGEVLGYPKCCIDFFKKNYTSNNPDLIRAITENSNNRKKANFSFYINYAARYFGNSIISHFPCSWNCEASTNLAKQYLDCFKQYFPKDAEELVRILKMPVLYSDERLVLLKDMDIKVSEKSPCIIIFDQDKVLSNTNVKFNKIIYKKTVSRCYMGNKYKFSLRNPLLLRFR